MKVKTNELVGAALDWAVAKAEQPVYSDCALIQALTAGVNGYGNTWEAYSPSTEWAQGGPIIERERINIHFCQDLKDRKGLYIHAEKDTHRNHGYWRGNHDHPLIAAMRCYVASKFGEEVDVPDELL